MMPQKPITFILFGATGDLARQKILPALCGLVVKNALPEGSRVIAYSRRAWDDEKYREFIISALKDFSHDEVKKFLSRVEYVQGTFDDPDSYTRLKKKISTGEILFHLAVQPIFYEQIIAGLGVANLRGKILVEKPFGHDLESAEELEKILEQNFPAEYIFRVDHYLSKKGLDEVLETRRTDFEFELHLANKELASITCRILSQADVHDRGEFYDAVGELRDVGQNHLLQMLAVVLIDLREADVSLSIARAHALQKLAPISDGEFATCVVRGQYDGYQNESGVAENSQTETYFKLILQSDDPRWRGIPLTLEGGKAMRDKKTTIEISFRDGSQKIFDIESHQNDYEAVIEAAITDDKSRFASIEEIVACWKLIDPIIKNFSNLPLRKYAKGSQELATQFF
jgi:glucose-6-phosphate 1-dehydrogenase